MLHRWINAIRRKNGNLTKFTKICAKHFSDDDFEMASTDKCQSRQNKRGTQQLKRTRLKANAVPHIKLKKNNQFSFITSAAVMVLTQFQVLWLRL